MSIINGLLTGGILIGKICQAIGGANANRRRYVDEDLGITVEGDLTSGGVMYFRTNAGNTDKAEIHIFNPSTDSQAMVCVPNIPESNKPGVIYFIHATEKIPFSEAENPDYPPTISVLSGISDSKKLSSEGGAEDTIFKLAFDGLKMGTTISIGSFKIECNTTQLIIFSAGVIVTAISYMYFRSRDGIEVTSQKSIPPATGIMDDAGKQIFNIDFYKLGFDMNKDKDILKGYLFLQTGTSHGELVKLSKVASQPLHPAERKFFGLD